MKLSLMIKKNKISQEEKAETSLSSVKSTVSRLEGEYTENELRDIAGVNVTNTGAGNKIAVNDMLLPEQPNEAEQAELDDLKVLAGI